MKKWGAMTEGGTCGGASQAAAVVMVVSSSYSKHHGFNGRGSGRLRRYVSLWLLPVVFLLFIY